VSRYAQGDYGPSVALMLAPAYHPRTRIVSEPTPAISFPVVCATCASVAGFPFKASTTTVFANAIQLSMRCRACHAEWDVTLRTSTGNLRAIESDDDSAN